MPIPDFITSTIIFDSPPLGLPSLNIPLVAGILTAPQETAWDSIYGASVDVASLTPSTYAAALTALGITTGEDLQVGLTAMFSQRFEGQQSAPAELLLARRATPVAEVVTVTIDAFEAGNYTITINGTAFIEAGDTDEPTTAGNLRAAINLGSEPVTASGAGADVVLTADEPGVPFSSSSTHSVTPANISQVTTVPNGGIAEDLAAWRLEDDRWYFFLETTRSSGVITAAAVAVEAIQPNRIFVAQTDDPLAQTGASTDDLASQLGSAGLGLIRTAIRWHPDDDVFEDFAIVGKMCGFLPGDANWVHHTLSTVVGSTSAQLTSTATLDSKRYSWNERYDAPVPPQTSTRGGKMLDGNWIDLVWLVDDLNQRIQIREYSALQNGNTPYFGGEPAISGSLTGAINERAGAPGQGALTAGTIVVTVPPAADQANIDRLDRRYEGVVWSAQTQGFVNIVSNVGYLEQ